jgi:protein-S-isoprenylcysteine O-methyltransferase Ste14
MTSIVSRILWFAFIIFIICRILTTGQSWIGLALTLSWAIFLFYWVITARRTKAIAEKQSLASALAHRIPVMLSWILLVCWKLPPPMNLRLIPQPEWVLISGVVICVLGLVVTIWARRTLAGNWSSDVTFKEGHELIKTGPYHFARHPIYTGLLIMCLGTAIDIGTLRGLLATVLMAIAFWIKLKQEERLLLRHFPDQYPAYCREVKALVPFVI